MTQGSTVGPRALSRPKFGLEAKRRKVKGREPIQRAPRRTEAKLLGEASERFVGKPRLLVNPDEPRSELYAPLDGMIFGLPALPNVAIGDGCRFYAELQGELPE